MIKPELNLYDLTGYPSNSIIPSREAASQVVEYFYKIDKFTQFLNLYIHLAQTGFKGEIVALNNIKKVIKEMSNSGYYYRNDLKKVVKVEKDTLRNDWGFLETEKIYNFCFASVDICGNSRLVRNYDHELIRRTYLNYKNLVITAVEKRNGRIWSWEGDGGLISFHIKDTVNDAVLAAYEIISSMTVFNATMNYLNENLCIRIGINSGSARYKSITSTISSDAIDRVREIEKKHTLPMTISISQHTFVHVNAILRKYFNSQVINGETIYQLQLPIRR
ncbi:MAG: hypothetical protein MJB14_15705 [Spirochaetes bacterium]|nr:hypothetical protein [Spirochaetota bacterium]